MGQVGDTAESRLKRLTARFPNMAGSHARLTSPDDPGYNCLAWAVHDTRRCWHPSAFGGLFWPGGSADDTLSSWIRAYTGLGFERSGSAEVEVGKEKLAIYADDNGPSHVARQLPNGWWTSKLGPREDIEHELDALTGDQYGQVVVILSRAV